MKFSWVWVDVAVAVVVDDDDVDDDDDDIDGGDDDDDDDDDVDDEMLVLMLMLVLRWVFGWLAGQSVSATKQLQSHRRKSKRTARVLHLKNQNVIGASVVKHFMETNVRFRAGTDQEITACADKVRYLEIIPTRILNDVVSVCSVWVVDPVPWI